MRRRLTILCALIGLGVALTSCAEDAVDPAGAASNAAAASATPAQSPASAAAVPGAAISPCSVLTAADVTDVIGEAVSGPEENGFECSFRRNAAGGLVTRAVRIRLETSDASPYDLYQRYTAAIQQALGTPYDPEPVVGVGSTAGWDGDALLVGERVDAHLSAFLMVQLDGVAPDQERAFAERLARAALARVRQKQS